MHLKKLTKLYLFSYYVMVRIFAFNFTGDRLLPLKSSPEPTINEILSQYFSYEVIIHVDNDTIKDPYIFTSENDYNAEQVKLIFNYDTINYSHLRRPTGYKFVNVVFLGDLFRFQWFSSILFNLEYDDVILILCRDEFTTEIQLPNVRIVHFWQQKGFDRAGSVLVLHLGTNTLYYEHFYCGNLTGTLRRIPDPSNSSSTLAYLNDFTDFNGHEFEIAYMPYLPFFWCEEGESRDCTEAGSEGNLLKLLSKTLNFKYSLVNFEGHVGGEWRAMVEAVHFRLIDWAVGGISVSPDRAEMADLTTHIHTEAYTVMYRCCSSDGSSWRSWQQFLRPFNDTLWTCLGLTLLLVGFLLKGIYKEDRGSVTSNLMTTMRGLLEQPLIKGTTVTRTASKRLLLMGWWCGAIIIVTAYKSKLASTLIHPHFVLPNAIHQLLEENYRFQVNNNDWSVLKENLEESLDPSFKQVLKRSKDDLGVCEAVEEVVKRKVAIIDEDSSLQYEVIMHCRSRLNAQDFVRLRVLDERVFPSFHVWPLQLGAPYRHRFSKIITDLHSAGILNMWYHVRSKYKLTSSSRLYDVSSAEAYSISTMHAPFLILLTSLMIAAFVFLVEMIYFMLSNLFGFYKRCKCNRTN